MANIPRTVTGWYHNVISTIYALLLAYLGALWVASIYGFQGFAVGLMWLVGICVLPVAYFQPSNMFLLSMAEWLNRRDNPYRWDTVRVGVLLFICIMSAGGLSILLSIIGAGKAFPAVIAFIMLIIACMVYAGKVNPEKWMKVMAVTAVFLAVFSTIKVMPFGEWHKDVYDTTGYSVDVAPSQADVEARKTRAENERRADKLTAQCITEWKERHKGVVRESTIDRKSTRLNSSHIQKSRMPSSA